MNTVNSVIFKGNKNGIVIMLDESIPYENLKNNFKEKILQAKNFFGNSNTSISFKGRNLSFEEEEELLQIIFNETGLEISFVGEKNEIIKESTDNFNFYSNIIENVLNPVENITHYHKGSIRSGQIVNFSGSVVIIGDVNPGGNVVAGGNIIILGSLKGFVHAGALGDENCFVSAFDMKPTQLRIGGIFSYIPREMNKKMKKLIIPSLAFVESGKIYIEPLV